MLKTTNMIKNMRSHLLMSVSPSGSTCWFSATVSALAGGASETLLTRGTMSHGWASGINLTPVAGMFPLLLFQGICPVSLSCSLRIALWSCALNAGSPDGFPMGLVWAGGVPPLPRCWHLGSMVAGNCIRLLGCLGIELWIGTLVNPPELTICNMPSCEGYFVKIFTRLDSS